MAVNFSSEKEAFFAVMDAQYTSLTFDDVRLVTGPSNSAVPDIDLSTRFSRNVGLKTPFVSAAMDTVTESEMAIALAQMGGIGVVHAGLSPEDQARHVRRVKLALNGRIETPVVVNEHDSVENVLNMCADRGFEFRSFPVVDGDGTFRGLLTSNSIGFAEDAQQPVSQLMVPAGGVITGEPQMDIHTAYDYMRENRITKLPLIDKLGRVAGMYLYSDVQRIVRDNSGMYNVDANGRLRVAAAVPTDEHAVERVRGMLRYLDVAVVDTAQGDSSYAFRTLERLKEEFPDLDVVVGNISSARSAHELVERGADGIKAGQGGGSICTTRIETGIGTPQVSAVFGIAAAIARSRHPDVPVVSDGGIRSPGDVSIAIAAGASAVMMGNVLAGTDEAPGDTIFLENGRAVKPYRGMGSPGALSDSAASRARYGATGSTVARPEGVEGYVLSKGSTVRVLQAYAHYLRRSMSYVGAPDIETHQRDTMFTRITGAGMAESRPHDLIT